MDGHRLSPLSNLLPVDAFLPLSGLSSYLPVSGKTAIWWSRSGPNPSHATVALLIICGIATVNRRAGLLHSSKEASCPADADSLVRTSYNISASSLDADSPTPQAGLHKDRWQGREKVRQWLRLHAMQREDLLFIFDQPLLAHQYTLRYVWRPSVYFLWMVCKRFDTHAHNFKMHLCSKKHIKNVCARRDLQFLWAVLVKVMTYSY